MSPKQKEAEAERSEIRKDDPEGQIEDQVPRDNLDSGVDMADAAGDEPQGPEDALGKGPKRGDYSGRLDTTEHYESVPTGLSGTVENADGGIDNAPRFKLEHQNPRAGEQGTPPEGTKGGVDSAE